MIYVCVPTHNEARTVGVLVWKVGQILKDLGRDFEVLVLDDASTDNTREVLASYRRVLPLTVLLHQQRQGYDVAIETLLREAVKRSSYPKRDIILTMQADFTEDPADVMPVLKRIEAGADVVATSMRTEDPTRKLRWSRAAAHYLARRFRIAETGPEALSTLRAYRVFVVRKMIEGARGQRIVTGAVWAANAQLLRGAKAIARRVDVVEAELHPRRHQRETRLDPWGALKQVFSLRRGDTPTPALRENLAQVDSLRAPTPARRREPEVQERPRRGGGPRQRPEHAKGERQQRERPTRERPPRERPARERPTREKPVRAAAPAAEAPVPPRQTGSVGPATEEVAAAKKRRRRGRRKKKDGQTPVVQNGASTDEGGTSEGAEDTAVAEAPEAGATGAASSKRRRRGGRGGRRRRKSKNGPQGGEAAPEESPSDSASPSAGGPAGGGPEELQ